MRDMDAHIAVYKRYWLETRGETLVRASAHAVADLPLSAEDKAFLVDVGLPEDGDGAFTFADVPDGLTVGHRPGAGQIVMFAWEYFGSFFVCFDEALQRVVFVSRDERAVTPVASRVKAFCVMHAMVRQLIADSSTEDGERRFGREQTKRAFEDLELELGFLEPDILIGEENYWAVQLCIALHHEGWMT
jgi:hypothetical protein